MGFRKQDIEELLVATGRKCCICKILHSVSVHHIVAVADGGSDDIDNGIPLCPTCHDEVHKKRGVGNVTRGYTKEELKKHREKTIEENKNVVTQPNINNDLRLLNIIVEKANFDRWQDISDFVLKVNEAEMFEQDLDNFRKLFLFLLNRIIFFKNTRLESCLRNLQLVLSDFLLCFLDNSEIKYEGVLGSIKFYNINEWNPDKYNELRKEYTFQLLIVQDLYIELIRASNLFFDLIREYLKGDFRDSEGYLSFQHGPTLDLKYFFITPRYSEAEKTMEIPYINKEQFLINRNQRDFCVGIGNTKEDPLFKETYGFM